LDLDALEAIAEPVFVAFQYRPLSPDANDDMVLDVAINGNADAIVTNNTLLRWPGLRTEAEQGVRL
jgi:predicted nucleic acid-binding protein